MIAKKLKDILRGIEIKAINDSTDNPEISGVAVDSKKAGRDFIFIAQRGTKYDGHNFINEAERNGARVIVAEDAAVNLPQQKDVIRVTVSDSKKAGADIIHNFYDRPADKARVIAITGTNGKTTISYLIEAILKSAGFNVGVVGTINYRYGLREIPATNTTPGTMQLVEMMHYMVTSGAHYVVMEASSHSLEQGRVLGIDFKSAVFTNITPEHLDYHKTMQGYKNAKAMLFKGLSQEASAILNIDDEFSKELVGCTKANILKYGFAPGADVKPQKVNMSYSGSQFEVVTPAGNIKINTALAGRFNIYNILAAVGAGIAEGIDPEKISKGVESVKTVPGRLQEVSCGQPFKIYVDYAHTDDALKNVLTALKELTKSRIITLFGCGGDRDTSKRPRMAKVASEFSDSVIITTDNPRSENPQAIADQVSAGIPKSKSGCALVILDRKAAIKHALNIAKEGDIVLLAGKGHETYQILQNNVQPFDDTEEAKKILIEMGYNPVCLQQNSY